MRRFELFNQGSSLLQVCLAPFELPYDLQHRSEPCGVSFDRSYSYYSPAYERPGPEVRIHRLHDCTQGYGPR